MWVDNQFPYKLYGAQQDNSTVIITSQARPVRARGLAQRTGLRNRPDHPASVESGHRLWLVQGAVRRHEHEDRTGEELLDRGAVAVRQLRRRDLIYRMQRVSPMAISPHDPDILYYGSQYLHRTRDKGVTWEKISPDLTANPDVLPGRQRRTDHARRDRRGVLQHALRDFGIAAREGGHLDRGERRAIPRHA